MANLLYLVHRMPHPPNKGDKVRSYHLLEHLRRRHRVFVGTFVDDPDDEPHIDALRARCTELHVSLLHATRARLASLSSLVGGEALTLGYYRDAGLRRWVREVARRERIDAVVVFSSSMVPYADGLGLPLLVDFVDVDSAKWAEYAKHRNWPMSWLYRREGEQLLAHERAAAARAARSFFVTEKETELFRRLAPECATRVEALENGVDATYFAPNPDRLNPFSAGELPLVFTGAMDYWPNIDAVTWFAREVLPRLRERWPGVRLHIVGRAPAAEVLALAGAGVSVTGTVPDVRPYLQHAAVVVAPLRLARGLQNKVLEAMAMARPVVASAGCAEPIRAHPTDELPRADDAAGYVEWIDALLRDPVRAERIGAAGRRRVLADYDWAAQLVPLDHHLERLLRREPLAA